MTLPFVSYGGSSLVVNMIGTGLLIAVSRHRPPI
ncbi:MAG: FtsW/RodA/SpoVE family cell cycle protein [Nitrospirales bacterium]|nr:FtsW/RodA/SpoVE family cell cycle protein [Nitrospirales bacterium]